MFALVCGDQEEGSGLSTHRLALTMLIKIVKSLGCAYGCGEGHRGLSGDRLRMQVSPLDEPHCINFNKIKISHHEQFYFGANLSHNSELYYL